MSEQVTITLTREQWNIVMAAIDNYRMFEAEWQLLSSMQREVLSETESAIAEQLWESGVER